MAGKLGMKGGGGARPGAGRPKAKPVLVQIPQAASPMDFLLALMNDASADIKTRLAAAVALMPYSHAKPVAGVKDQAQAAAKKASSGKFAPSARPLHLIQ